MKHFVLIVAVMGFVMTASLVHAEDVVPAQENTVSSIWPAAQKAPAPLFPGFNNNNNEDRMFTAPLSKQFERLNSGFKKLFDPLKPRSPEEKIWHKIDGKRDKILNLMEKAGRSGDPTKYEDKIQSLQDEIRDAEEDLALLQRA